MARTNALLLSIALACAGGCGAGRPYSGASLGRCRPPQSSPECDSAPAFRFLGFTQNQHGQPQASCERALCRRLRELIDAAKTSIEFAIYGVRDQPAIIDALTRAQARGVRVRGVVDGEDADCSAFGYRDTATLIARLGPTWVRCDRGPGFRAIMHDKFFVFDAASVWTGSTNISDTELGGEYNSDVAMLIGSIPLAAIYLREFEEMFGGLFHHRKRDDTVHMLPPSPDGAQIESYFSPSDDATGHAVIPLIEHAAATLDIAMFYFTDRSIAAALIAAHARGVQVRMVLDAGGAASAYSAHRQLCAAGIDVKIENWGGKSHSKWAVADAALPTGSVLFGSMNWTHAGNADNDENTLVIHSAGLARQFAAEFARQWADLASVPSCRRVPAESAASSVCSRPDDCSSGCSSGACCDGIDNDYDGKIDLQEEACACADGVDNDGDGHIDRDDYDCRSERADP